MMLRWYGLMLGAVVSTLGCVATPPATVETSLVVPTQPLAYVRNHQVMVAAQNGTQAQLISLPTDVAFAPVFIDGGQSVLYVVQQGDFYELWRYQLATAQRQLLIALRHQPQQLAVSPNDTFMAYIANDILYVFNLTTQKQVRIHEGVYSLAWSPTGKQLVFVTNDNRLLLQSLTVTSQLDQPTTLREGEIITWPIWLDNTTLVYEGVWEEAITLLRYDIADASVIPITSLRFSATVPAAGIQLAPDGATIAYIRPDDITELPNVWIVPLNQDAPKLILTNAYTPIWNPTSDGLLYIESTVEPSIFSVTATGLDKTELISGGHSMVTPVQYHSNPFTISS
ncbi:MAG: hypothetical protein HYV33_02295 [Candidatus Kerfeldbacteria bacterium]|nr:hypothetical protein [Candidatus Kerfeldbacteria bacterium]